MFHVPEAVADRIRKEPPGLELVAWWCHAADAASEPARALLSHVAAGLVSRGWVLPPDRLLQGAVDALEMSAEQAAEAWRELCAADLATVEGDRVATLAGLFSTRPTGMELRLDDQHAVHLLGPLTAMAATAALGRGGEIRATCGQDGRTELRLFCDEHGVVRREPESMCLFLPAWTRRSRPATASAGGVMFADDEALWAWQEAQRHPDGMPLASMMFPMAAQELAGRLGPALRSVLDRLPDFA